MKQIIRLIKLWKMVGGSLKDFVDFIEDPVTDKIYDMQILKAIREDYWREKENDTTR